MYLQLFNILMNNHELALVIEITNTCRTLPLVLPVLCICCCSCVPLNEHFLVMKDFMMIVLGQTEFLQFCYS